MSNKAIGLGVAMVAALVPVFFIYVRRWLKPQDNVEGCALVIAGIAITIIAFIIAGNIHDKSTVK
jgi:uncharacterized membrane protein